MPGIGPELPPHLQGQSDEEETETVSVGPQIPPGLVIPQVEEDDDEDDYIPELPPDLAAARSATGVSTVQASEASSSVTRRVVGPSLPSYPPTYDPKFQAAYEEEDDDDFGPMPLPAGVRHAETDAVQEFMEREERRRKEAEEAAKPKVLKRDEWMLVPPSSSDLLGKLDPTKLKARQFSRSSTQTAKTTDNSLWTETPAERQQRLADEVSGKKRRAVDTAPDDDAGVEKKRTRVEEDQIRGGVDEYTQKLRGPALVAQYEASGKAEASKDKDAAIWDHSRDMSLGGRLMDDSKRKKLIREAQGLGDRFGAGKGGSFL